MTSPATLIGQSRIARLTLAVVGVTMLVVVASLVSEPRRAPLVNGFERTRAAAVLDSWRTATRNARCARPALREPTTDDGSRDFAGFSYGSHGEGSKGPVIACMQRLQGLENELGRTCRPRDKCSVTPLATVPAHPDVLAACAVVYARVAQHAHTARACSPLRPADANAMDDMPALTSLGRAVRLQAASLAAEGKLADATRAVTDAMRFADDYARNASLVGSMLDVALIGQLTLTLDELVADPRLTAAEAQAVVRDLDLLIATAPRFDEIVLGEAVTMLTYLGRFAAKITDDRAQDMALLTLGDERWLATYHRICDGAPDTICAMRLRGVAAMVAGDPAPDYEAILTSSHDPSVVRERLVASLATSQLRNMAWYADRLLDRERKLSSLRAKASARATGAPRP